MNISGRAAGFLGVLCLGALSVACSSAAYADGSEPGTLPFQTVSYTCPADLATANALDVVCSNDACKPIELANNQAFPRAIASHGGDLYWVSFGNGGSDTGDIVTIPAGAVTPAVMAAKVGRPACLVASDAGLFFPASTYAEAAGTDSAILGLAFGASVPFVVASDQLAHAIATDGNLVYWGDGGDILRGNAAGGPVLTLASPGGIQAAYSMVVSGGFVYWITAFSDELLDVDQTTVLTPGHSKIMRAPASGGAAETLVDAACALSALVVDDDALYWAHRAGGTIASISLADGTVTQLATSQGLINALVADETDLYWLDADPTPANGGTTNGSLRRLEKTGGTPETLASQLASPVDLIVDDADVTWVEFDAGLVRKLDKTISP